MAEASANPSSTRLELVPMTIAMLDAFSRGRLDAATEELGAEVEPGCLEEDDVAFFRRRLRELAENPDLEPWTVRAIVLREPVRKMIGHIGFHGPPGVNGPGTPDAVEIGYTVFPAARGLGYATEAASALIDWASRSHGIRHFIASVAPGNGPSEAIVAKLGFTHTGEQWDEEDGLEYIYEVLVV
jgi:[ribosomal protein S5]-alanine N-acetyltransferase